MLQQTRVEVVRDYFSRWMERFPSIDHLAQSDENDVLHLWQGLGYYSRARRLREGARYVQATYGGQLPSTPEELLNVPGIGPYSAGAISSIAFGKPSPIVDGNVIRVLCRYLGLIGDPNKTPLKTDLWRFAAQLVPEHMPGTFNQALMEFGATLCTPKSPLCHACPLSSSCRALATAQVQLLPQLPKPKAKTQLTLLVLVPKLKSANFNDLVSYGLIRLPSDARWWAGMNVFPFCEASQQQDVEVQARALSCRYLGKGKHVVQILNGVRHTVTRFELSLVPVVVELQAKAGAPELLWVGASQTDGLTLPSAHRKILNLIQQLGASS